MGGQGQALVFHMIENFSCQLERKLCLKKLSERDRQPNESKRPAFVWLAAFGRIENQKTQPLSLKMKLALELTFPI